MRRTYTSCGAGISHGSSREAVGVRPTFVNTNALDRLLLRRFGGKVRRGLAAELLPQGNASTQMESLFAPVLTGYTEQDESFDETGHNSQVQTDVCRETKGAWVDGDPGRHDGTRTLISWDRLVL
jgi:hypothetical protein